jgi:prepilin signal peptidase PulO-like enzyme (type II secretory pathway)
VGIFFIFFLFILGLFFGSFLNVLVDRLPNNKSILGRSHCEKCHKTLTWKDLTPLVSFIYLHGRCRYCQTKLSYQYPLLELVTGGLFILTYLFTIYHLSFTNCHLQFLFSYELLNLKSLILNLLFNLSIVSVFIVVFFADLKYGIIPDKIILTGIFATLIYLLIFNFQFFPLHPALQGFEEQAIFNEILNPKSLIINPSSLILNHLLSAIGAFLFFLILYLLTRGRGMGFGDVKLAFLLGLVLGFPGTFYAIYIAFLTGGLVGIILILWKKKKMKSSVAFGPFLILGSFISLFFTPLLNQLLGQLL